MGTGAYELNPPLELRNNSGPMTTFPGDSPAQAGALGRHDVSSPSTGNLSVTGFAFSPNSVVRDDQVNVTVQLSGGVAPYTFAFQGLPYGCLSLNESTFSCFPSEVGTFQPEVQVTDVAGDVADANSTVSVTPGGGAAPKISSFSVSPTTVDLRHPAYIDVNAVSESSTPTSILAYSYFGLPPGCASFNQTNLTCSPTQSGTFKIEVEVTDGFGSFSYASVNLTVEGGSSSSSGGSGGIPSLAYTAIIGVVGVVIAALIYVRGRRPSPPSGGGAK